MWTSKDKEKGSCQQSETHPGGPGQLCEVWRRLSLAKATEILERLPGHTVDVGVNLSRVFVMMAGGDSSSLVPGSLASPGVDNEKEDEELESLVFSSENECLNLLNKYLVEASPRLLQLVLRIVMLTVLTLRAFRSPLP